MVFIVNFIIFTILFFKLYFTNSCMILMLFTIIFALLATAKLYHIQDVCIYEGSKKTLLQVSTLTMVKHPQ